MWLEGGYYQHNLSRNVVDYHHNDHKKIELFGHPDAQKSNYNEDNPLKLPNCGIQFITSSIVDGIGNFTRN